MALIATLSSENAYQAQHIRLRLAERLVEHFTVQRHVFNPLRLMHWLAQELPATEVATFSDLPAYFGVLAQQSELPAAIERPPTQGISPVGIPAGEVMTATITTAAPRFDVAEARRHTVALFAALAKGTQYVLGLRAHNEVPRAICGGERRLRNAARRTVL